MTFVPETLLAQSVLSTLSTAAAAQSPPITLYLNGPPAPTKRSYPYTIVAFGRYHETRLEGGAASSGSKDLDGTVILDYIDLLVDEQGTDYSTVRISAEANVEVLRQAIRSNNQLTLAGVPNALIAGEVFDTDWDQGGQTKDRAGTSVFFVRTTMSIRSEPIDG